MDKALETKVVVGAVGSAVVALLGILAAFGLDVSDGTQERLLAIVSGLVPLAVLVLGYLAPHTSRPDLADTHPEAEADVEAWTTEQEAGA